MRNALKRIQTGEYAKMFIPKADQLSGMTARRRLNAVHRSKRSVASCAT
jgi:ketol-acid reductoisomerase